MSESGKCVARRVVALGTYAVSVSVMHLFNVISPVVLISSVAGAAGALSIDLFLEQGSQREDAESNELGGKK